MNTATLKKQIQAILNHELKTWGEISCVLDQVASTEVWRHEKASYTAWVQGLAEEMGTNPQTLWRYLSSGRYYNSLLKNNIQTTEQVLLQDLPNIVSPENLEILSKIERVAPPDVFCELLEKVVTAKITRAKLRIVWESYRSECDAPSNRGRGAPAVSFLNSLGTYRAKVMSVIRLDQPTWTGHDKIDAYRLHSDIKIPKSGTRAQVKFDGVAVIKHHQGKNEIIDVHGVTVYTSGVQERPKVYFDRYAQYVNYLWWVLPAGFESFDIVPDDVGTLIINNSKIVVVRQAKRCKPCPEFSEVLLRELLFSK